MDFQGTLKKLSKKNLEKLKKRIIEDGFNVPFFVWDNAGEYMIMDGHGRLKALLSLRAEGYDMPLLPVAIIEASDITDARKKLLAISSQYGEFDVSELGEWLSDMDASIAETLRLVDTEMALDMGEPEETVGDDEVADVKETITVLGDLWELGSHRVLCGDSTDAETVGKLMDGKKADMVFTDPPYGMSLDTDYKKVTGSKNAMHKKSGKAAIPGKKYKSVKGDNEDFTPKLIDTVFDNFGYCKEIFLWGADYYSEYIPKKNEGSWVVWDKITTKEGIVSEGASKMFGSCFELCWSKTKHKRDIIRMFHKGFTSVDNSDKVHPTQKPIQLTEWFIDKWDCDKVVDLYLGSGSTLIACEKTNRICYGMELDPHYCDVIVGRYVKWCSENNREATIKRNGEPYTFEEPT